MLKKNKTLIVGFLLGFALVQGCKGYTSFVFNQAHTEGIKKGYNLRLAEEALQKQLEKDSIQAKIRASDQKTLRSL